MLLFTLLSILTVSTAAPVPAEVVKMKLKVKRMAQQLVVRIKDFQVPPGLKLSSTVDRFDGLSSIVSVLEGYNSLISDEVDGVDQIKCEISSLSGYLHRWRLGHCSEQHPKPPMSGALLKLQSSKEYTYTVSMEAIVRVREFLNVTMKNLENLESC